VSGPDSGEALEALSLSYGGLVALMDRFGETDDGIERRSLLISMVAQSWQMRDCAADAYAALEVESSGVAE
jgi:hypothetical protein